MGGVIKFRMPEIQKIDCPVCEEKTYQEADGMILPRPCRCRRELDRSEQLDKETFRRRYERSGITKRIFDYRFKNYDRNYNMTAFIKAVGYTKNFEDYLRTGKGLLITGSAGTGKTHLAGAIANEIIKKYQVLFGTMIDYLEQIKNCYKGAERDVIQRLQSVPLLIIDDLGKEKKTDWVLEKLFEILNHRYNNNLPVIITTNFNIIQLREVIGEACLSRIFEICDYIEMVGNDYRVKIFEERRGA